MKTDREKYGLSGPVKNVLVEKALFEESNGQTAEKPWFSHTINFNRDGQLTEQVTPNMDGSELRTVYHYSDSGHLLATRSLDHSGAPNDEMKYIYDDEGKLVAEQHITRDGRVTTPTTYAYDSVGGKVKIEKLDFPGEASVMIGIEGTNTTINADGAERVESRYDDRGEVVEVKVFDMGGALLSRMEITRGAQGNSLEETQYIGDVFPVGSCAPDSFSAEEMVPPTEEQKAEIAAEIARLFSLGTVMSKHNHTYDTEGRLIESKLTMMGMEASRQTFAYDEVGNRSEEVSYNGTFGTRTVFAREYDEHGNWIKELVSTASSWDAEFGMSIPAHVTRRVMTYW